jgi:uncharacterized protein
MIRIVLDTNVLYSAVLKPIGVPAAVFDLVIAGTLTPCISDSVLAEYHEVLNRPVLHTSAQRARKILELLAIIAVHVKPMSTVRACKDPDDDIFLECAEAGEADFLITGNLKHFPKDRRWKNTRIVTSRELLDILGPRLQLPSSFS